MNNRDDRETHWNQAELQGLAGEANVGGVIA